MGIEENNLPIPNAAEWELKTQKRNTNSLLTLFHMEPSPTALKFVPQILLPHFGWTHKEAGKKYPNTEKSFRQTIRAGLYSNRGFTIKVNRKEQRIEVCFDYSQIDKTVHPAWHAMLTQQGQTQLDPAPYWGFQDFYHKLGTKLHNCFYIVADSKREQGKNHFKYTDILMLKGLSLDKTLDAVEQGKIYVDFDARTNHNHGTKFRITASAIKDLYAETLAF